MPRWSPPDHLGALDAQSALTVNRIPRLRQEFGNFLQLRHSSPGRLAGALRATDASPPAQKTWQTGKLNFFLTQPLPSFSFAQQDEFANRGKLMWQTGKVILAADEPVKMPERGPWIFERLKGSRHLVSGASSRKKDFEGCREP
jgi:hypothetical protein